MAHRSDINELRARLRYLDPRVLMAEAVIIIAVMGVLAAGLVIRFPDIMQAFGSVEDFEAFMEAHREGSVPLYITIQAVQVFVSVIPGQLVQIAGGYLYGFWPAVLWSLIGLSIGATGAFYLARYIGQIPMKRAFGADMVEQYTSVLSSPNAFALMLFLYIVPGFPKDFLAFFAGLSGMKYRRFIPMAAIARFPAMAASMLIGSQLGLHSYKASAAMMALCLIFIIFCYVFRKKLLRFSDRYFGIR